MGVSVKTFLSHRSIRKYQNRPKEKEILDEILKAMQAVSLGGIAIEAFGRSFSSEGRSPENGKHFR